MKAPLSLTLLCLAIFFTFHVETNGQQTIVEDIDIQAMNQGLFNGGVVNTIEDTFFLFKDFGEDFTDFVQVPLQKLCLPPAAVNTLNDAIAFINSLGFAQVTPLTEACFGPDLDINFGFDMDAYFRTLISAGDVDIIYPIQATIEYPDPGTVPCNEYIVVHTSGVEQPGYDMVLQEPEMDFAIGARLRSGLYLNGEICAFSCFPLGSNGLAIPSGFASATEDNYKSKLGGGDTDIMGFSTTTGIKLPWNYSPLIPAPPGIPNLTLPLITTTIPGDPLGNYANIYGTLDNPFGALNGAEKTVNGQNISATHEQTVLSISFDPIQFQEYVTGVPLTISKNLGGGVTVNASLISLPFIVDLTQVHQFNFDFEDVNINFVLSEESDWKEVTPGGDTIRDFHGLKINDFTLGNQLLVTPSEGITITPSYTISSNTFMTNIFQQIQFSWAYKVMDLYVTFPAINGGSICDKIIGDLNIPNETVADPFNPTSWCPCLFPSNPDYNPEQPSYCIGQWACEYNEISLKQFILNACNGVVNIAASGSFNVAAISGTVDIGPPLQLPAFVDSSMFTLTFTPAEGTPINVVPDMTVPVVTPVTEFIWDGSPLKIFAIDLIEPIPHMSAYFNDPYTKFLYYNECSSLGTDTAYITADNNCTTQPVEVIFTVKELIPPSCADVTSDTLQILAGAVFKPGAFWTGSRDDCTIFLDSCTVSPNVFTCAEEGVHELTLTLKDVWGNTTVCNAYVDIYGPGQKYYVDENATGNGNGLSWANAFTTLQDALFESCSGTTIYMAEGTYYPTNGADETIAHVINNQISIYGGFSPTNGVTDLNKRDWNLYPTILSGDIDQDGLLDGDNAQSVLVVTGNAVFDGLIIEAGNADDGGGPSQYNLGGGVYNASNSLFRNCVFRINRAVTGGAVYTASGAPTFINCQFYNNEAVTNSSVLAPADGSPALIHCVVTENTSSNASISVDLADVTLSNCIFWNNGLDLSCQSSGTVTVNYTLLGDVSLPACAVDGGGNLYTQDPLFEDASSNNYRLTEPSPAVNSGDNSLVTVALDFDRDNRIFQNFVDRGAFEFQCPEEATPTTLIVTNATDGDIGSFKNLVEQFACPGDTILFDPALNGIPLPVSGDQIDMVKGVIVIGNGYENTIIDGGQSTRILRIYDDATAELRDMTFRNGNTIDHGGAIYTEGNVTVDRCLFSANEATGTFITTANHGGAIYIADGSFVGTNLVITGNAARLGGGFACGGGTAMLYHTTIAGNYGTLAGGGISHYPGGNLTLYNSVVWANYANSGGFTLAGQRYGSYEGSGNLINNVAFVDPLYAPDAPMLGGDYQLTLAEPGVNSGNNDFVNDTVDFLGNTRILDGVVDPGAYERTGCALENYNLYVDISAPGGGDGLSWSTAYNSLKTALDELNSTDCTVIIDSVLVAEGNYTYVDGLLVTVFFNVNRPTVLVGGYPAGGGVRDWVAYPTVLNGYYGNPITNHPTVIQVNDDAEINGFIIENGEAGLEIFPNPILGYYYIGGGIINKANAIYRNCIIRNNTALYGAGLYSYYGDILVENCVFYDNVADHPDQNNGNGSAVYIADGNATLINNTFHANPGDPTNTVLYYRAGTHQIANSILWEEDVLIGSHGDATVNATYNLMKYNVFDGIVNLDGTNMYGLDPLFVNAVARDYQLLPCSPAIDAGDMSLLVETGDFFGNSRVYGPQVDLGFHEVQSPFIAQETVAYVDSSVAVGGNGMSWATAFKTLTAALDATANCGVDTIHVAKGTYYPTNTADRTLSHTNYNSLVILGGYPSGGGTRDWGVNKTILSGDINTNGVADAGDSYSTFINTGDLELNGVIIEGGFADGTGTFAENGGGIHNGGPLRIYNSIIRNNHAPSNLGGGIYHYGPSLEMVNVLMHDNSGQSLGAAIHLEGTGSYAMTNCTVADNISDTDATAVIYNEAGQTGLLQNCILWNPGEGEIRNANTNTLANTIIEGGKPGSVLDGGGIAATSPSFTDVTIRDYTLRPCSPAVDQGLSPLDFTVFNMDVGGLDRSRNVTVDIGAFELQGSPAAVSDHTNIYVDQSAPAGGDGYTWATAYQSMQTAISHETTIVNCEKVDTIFIAEGSYLSTTAQDPFSKFHIPTGMELVVIGGYPAGGGVRDYAQYETILDGDIAGSTNSYTVLHNQGTLTLDGVTVANGVGHLSADIVVRHGAGIHNAGGLVINNCIIRDNSTQHFGWGGGIYQGNGGPLEINNSLFLNNAAYESGGAIYKTGSKTVTIRNSTFYGNFSDLAPYEAIYISGSSPFQCYNSIFWNESAAEFDNTVSAVSLQNSIIEGGVPGAATDLGDNISSNPEFVLGGDYALKPCSPGINAGSNSFIPFLPDYDLGNQPRVSQGTIDIGAYEYPGPDSYIDSTQLIVICSSDSVFLEGAWQHASGIYLDTIPSADCDVHIDTALATTLTVLPIGLETVPGESCLFMNTGSTMDTIVGGSANGCDSIVTNDVSYLTPEPEFIHTLVCDKEEIGITTDTLFGGSSEGCDSIRIFINSIRRLYPSIDVSIACGDSILIGGQYRKLPGTYNDTIQTGMGCDSIVPKLVSLTYPDKYYVDATATGVNNGHDWANAFPDLQSALLNSCLQVGDTILVAEGTYYPDEGGGMLDGDRNAVFAIPFGTVVMGGYPSGGGVRDLASHATVLSGDLGQDDLNSPPQMLSDILGDNAFTVVNINEAILDGVTITAGHADVEEAFPSLKQRGAGLLNTGDSEIRNCIITGNYATGSGANGIGAGVYHLNGDARYSNCLVVRNTATGQGGGFNCAFGNPILVNCTIAYNTDGGVQGGLAGTSAQVTMENTILWGNDDQTAIIGTGSIAFANSILEGTVPTGISYTDAGANTTQDPLFIDIVNNNFHVDNCLSPANDGGRNDLVTDDIDLDQDVRIQGGTVDVGAYENAGYGPLIVTTTLDDGLGSLRAVIADVCANGIVQFDPGLGTQTIHLTGNRILLDRNMQILGLGMDNLYISGEGTDGVFEITPGRVVHIEELNMLDGHPTDGVILNQGELIIKNVRIQN